MTRPTIGRPRRETYVCLDVELDGQAPGLSSMLSFGAVAAAEGAVIATFTANLQPLPEGQPDPATMTWWSHHREEWELAQQDARPAADVTPEFVEWLEKLPGDYLIAVGAPAVVDFGFVNYYCHRFAGRNPLGYTCLDLLSLALGRLRAFSYSELENNVEHALGFDADPALHAHVALDDALQQARLLAVLLDRSEQYSHRES